MGRRRGPDETLREAFGSFGWLSIVRESDQAAGATTLSALLHAGVRFLEISATTPGWLDLVEQASGEAGTVVGAGTVLTGQDALDATAAGATFLVMPHTDPALVGACVRTGVAVLAGALTPSEVVSAWSAGAAAVKLFPASLGGPGYLRELRGPLPQIPLVPTGGVTGDNTGAYLDNGAIGVAVSGWLTRSPEEIPARVATLRAVLAARAT